MEGKFSSQVKTDDLISAAIIVLARNGVPPDVQELLIRGDNRGAVAPGALATAMSAALSERDGKVEMLAAEVQGWRDATMEARKGCRQRSRTIDLLHQHIEALHADNEKLREFVGWIVGERANGIPEYIVARAAALQEAKDTGK